jgi:hypothetical protein
VQYLRDQTANKHLRLECNVDPKIPGAFIEPLLAFFALGEQVA